MCLVTSTSSSLSSSPSSSANNKKSAVMPKPSSSSNGGTTPTRQSKSKSPSRRQQLSPRSNGPSSPSSSSNKAKKKKNRARARLWVIFLVGSCWSLYSLSIGRAELADVFQQELEQEAKYLSTLFQNKQPDNNNNNQDGTTAVSGKSAFVSAADAIAARNQGVTDGQSYQSDSRFLRDPIRSQFSSSSFERNSSSASAQHHHTHQGNYQIDFTNLAAERNHAIVIPYRDRKFHLERFIEHMGPYLKRNFPDDTFELWVIEQDDDFLFNRAWLANVGIASIRQQNRLYKYQLLQQYQSQDNNNNNDANNNQMPPVITVPPPPHCIILHDVDLIPMVDGVPYTNCSRPMQLGTELAHFNNSIPYPLYTGGVGPSMLLDHWIKINGMSNDFYGWGGEDDELWHRLRLNKLLKRPRPRPTPAPAPSGEPYKGPKFWPPEIERPPKGKGKFQPISEAQTVHHNQKTHNQWNRIGYMLELMQNNSARWKRDGLNDLKMTVTGDAMTITHMDSIDYNNHTIQTDASVISTSQASTTTMTRKHYATAKQQGSIVSSLSIEPTALASFAAIHHIKAIPKLTALEFIHVTQTDGGRVERAGARAGISWGACHYHHALEVSMNCPDRLDPEWEGKAKQRPGRTSHTPWHSPLQDFEENPYKGRPTFAIVRNPYERLIDFFYCPWNGYKEEKLPNATDLNLFLQNAMFPPAPKAKEGKEGDKKTEPPKPPTPTAWLYLRPQSHYVFANDQIALYSKPFVTHIIHYENMEEDFDNLMHMYGLNKVQLPERLEPSGTIHPRGLTPLHFSVKTLNMIHRFYAGDFGRFGYRQIREKTKSK